MPNPPINNPRDLITRSCRALFAPSQVVECRAIGLNRRAGHSAAGWFDDAEKLATAAMTTEARYAPEGIYVTLNQMDPACLARCANELRPYQKTTTADRDITRRHWLPIDLDPARPSKISSSDDEIEAARKMAGKIIKWLETSLKLPPGIRAFSSNGLHLLYRIDLPNDDESTSIVSRCLYALHEKYSNRHVSIDVSNSNPARIWKLWGTMSRKGSNLVERPHRRSMMWPQQTDSGEHWPTFDEFGVVTIDQLTELASLAADQPRKHKKKGIKAPEKPKIAKDIDLDAFIAKHNIAVAESKPWDAGGMLHVLESCLFDASHTGSSAILGKSSTGAVFYKCQHDSCTDKRWSDVKGLFDEKGTTAKTKVAPSINAVTENPYDLARDFLRDRYEDADGQITLRRYRESFYIYEPARFAYREATNDALKNEVTIWLSEFAEKITRTVVADVIACINAHVTIREDLNLPLWTDVRLGDMQPIIKADPSRRNWLCMKNGMLDVDKVLANEPIENCLQQGTPQWFNIVTLAYNFDEDADCPRWLKFLDEIMEGDDERIAIIQEMFAYCFWDSAELEKFFICIGGGQNGKSTLLKVLEELIGPANVSALAPNEMEDKFLRLGLWGKLANLCLDMDEIDKVGEGLLKKITSGDRILGDRKFKDFTEWHPTVTLIFATNTMPRFVDVTQGIWRRAMIIPFDVTIPDSKKDTKLFSKLCDELPGIFLWTLHGMVRLMREHRFTYAEACYRAHRDEKRKALPIEAFLVDECIEDPEKYISVEELWTAYRKWCVENGLTKPKPKIPFAKDVRALRPELKDCRKTVGYAERKRVLVGLTLRPHTEPAAQEGWSWQNGES